jgi:long-chain acyl-CoA synthetase
MKARGADAAAWAEARDGPGSSLRAGQRRRAQARVECPPMAPQRHLPRPDEAVSGGPAPEPEVSLAALFRDRAARWPERPALRYRGPTGKWQDLTWAELDGRRRALAAGLCAAGTQPGDRVALLSDNRVEMLLAEAAIASVRAACAPIYPEYGPDTLCYCLQDCGARLVLCGSAAQQERLPPPALLPRVRRVLVLDDRPLPGQRGEPISALLEEGRRSPTAHAEAEARSDAAEPADLAYLLYTSGTTGRPKGVELTGRNVLSQQAALALAWDVNERDVFLGYLPWHHCFGGLFERLTALSRGALFVLDDSCGRNLEKLVQNLREVRPTVYFSVPRIYQALIGHGRKDPSALDALLHPGLRFVFTAAAPLPLPAYRVFEERGVPVMEGWGLTETSPCVTLTPQVGPRAPGVVGWPLPGTTVRLIPSSAADERGAGEIIVRGPQVMRGYHGDPEATARVLDQNGWLRTGDLGEWTPQGLRIKGRADGVFKLENGEKVATGEIEARLLAASPLVEQALVIGSGQPHATALVWLSRPAVRNFCEAHNLSVPPPAEMAALPELRLALGQALRASNLLTQPVHERVRRVALLHEPPAMEHGEMTPTGKMVRTVLLERHAALVAALQGRGMDPRILELGKRDE